MGKRDDVSCNDCYFRQAGLCALPGDAPCPTFRLAKATLEPPPQPRLVPRTTPQLAFHPAHA